MDPELYKAAMEGNMGLIVQYDGRLRPNLTFCLTPQKNTVLHIAVKFEKKEIVQRIIELCPSLICQPNSKGDTPLHVAARVGNRDLTMLPTLELNLLIYPNGNPALEEGHSVRRAIRVALRMRNLEGSNPIHEALKKRHGDVALQLLAFEGGHHKPACDVNMARESLLYLAAEAGLEDVVYRIIDGGYYSTEGPDGQNPLHIAVIKGRLGVVKILLVRERNLIPQADCFGNTVLHYASDKSYRRVSKDKERLWTDDPNQIEILQLLLKDNPSLAYVPNINGDYPLFMAIRKEFDSAVRTIISHCPDSVELVDQKGQNALHLAVIKKDKSFIKQLIEWPEFRKLINEPDNDGNTPMHLATRMGEEEIVRLLIQRGAPDLTMSNKDGLTAMDICEYTDIEHPIRDKLRGSRAVPGRKQWQQEFPVKTRSVDISPEFKKLGLQTLPIVTSLVATVTFAAAFTVPGGYKNDGSREGFPVFMRNAALQAFVLSDTLAFCSSMAATVLLIYANAVSHDAFKVYYAIKTCYWISAVAILATITAFLTAVYVLTSKESLWLAVASLVLGCAVPLFLACYWCLQRIWNSCCGKDVEYSFGS